MSFEGSKSTALVLHTPKKVIRAKCAQDFASTQSFTFYFATIWFLHRHKVGLSEIHLHFSHNSFFTCMQYQRSTHTVLLLPSKHIVEPFLLPI